MKLKILLLIGLMLTGSSYAATFIPKTTTDKKVLGYFHKLLPTTTINAIYTTPYPDTYALLMGSNIIYGNIHSNYLTAGHMFDIYTRDDITDTLQKLNTPKIDISQINIADALVAKASGKVNKKLIIFIDPDCPYCRQLETQIYVQGIDKKADLYYMLMPLSMHPNAKVHTSNILCSANPLDILKEYMVNNNDNPKVKLTDGCNIDAVLERTGSTARSLSINGTPAIITGEGSMIMGADIQAINEYVNRK
jgi:thiol:disulfide interchange protein DsbC